jgi:hypothetical protein
MACLSLSTLNALANAAEANIKLEFKRLKRLANDRPQTWTGKSVMFSFSEVG